MRARVILIVVALAVLTYAGLRHLDRTSPDLRSTSGASGLAGQPAPDPALPAIVNAMVITSIAARTLPHSGWHRHLRPAQATAVASHQTALVQDTTARRRTFPLLI